MKNIFIDGSSGTTGLKIYNRLERRDDINLITLKESERKDINKRREAINSSDITFLCLPDDAARDAVNLVYNENTVIIDTSSAHRTIEGWTYGFPELKGKREEIKKSKRIGNPGCHATGFIALITPLIENNIINKESLLSVFSLTGYSGGGKNMINDYEDNNRSMYLDAPRMYGLSQNHKHLKEMCKITGLESEPIFTPIVGDFYSGMEVVIPIFKKNIRGNKENIEEIYENYYRNTLVRFVKNKEKETNFLSSNYLSSRDHMEIYVVGSSEKILLIGRYDNLGKGASGAAIQNMNISMGIDEYKSLNI